MKKLTIIFFMIALTTLSSCKVGRFVYYNFANITDHKIFPSRSIQNDSIPFHFKETMISKIPDSITVTIKEKKERMPFERYLDDNNTVAFLVIKNDTIDYERYFSKYDKASIVASFSMAKSVTSLLIGCAIDDGLIKSVDEPISNYLPELASNGLSNVTIRNLLQMTSGIEFSESYFNPFAEAGSFYYGRNLKKEVGKLKPKTAPGTQFEYSSGDTQILGLVLEKALKGKTISLYLEEKIWKPLGMEYDASWSLDKKKDGVEKTFCCINARARDFAKIGRLYLNNGNWNGKQIVSESWIKASTKAEVSDGSSPNYQYQWWIPSQNGDFAAQGILGQYIYVNPAKNLIVVRLGKNSGNTSDWLTFFQLIAQKY